MSSIQVRHADPRDETVLARIFREASLSNAGDRDVLLAHPEALTLSVDLVGGRTWVATDADGAVLGFATTRRTGPGVLELDDLFVDPRVMRQGVARHLIRRLATEAEREDVGRIDVTANPHAFGFYGAVGFVFGPRSATEFGAGRRMHLDVAAAVPVVQNSSGHHGVTGQPNAVEAWVTAPGLTSVTRPAACSAASETPPR
jgi:ribosomal protein S18 acetylase RimI-like enzyme